MGSLLTHLSLLTSSPTHSVPERREGGEEGVGSER